MGFFDDLLRGATAPGVMQNGMNIGISGMAEAQRRKEEQALIQRQQEEQAFNRMMKQREFDQNQKNWQTEFDTNKFFEQQKATDALSQLMMSGQNALADNALQKQKYENVELPESKAKISNYQEGRAPSQEEFIWQRMTPEQQQEFIVNYVQNKFKPAAAGNQGAKITPAGLVSLRGQMTNPIQGGRMDMPFDSVAAMAGRIQNTADSLNNANGGQPMMQQGQSQIHPALQKMVQDGITKEQILQDYLENEAEYQQMGITLEMLQGL